MEIKKLHRVNATSGLLHVIIARSCSTMQTCICHGSHLRADYGNEAACVGVQAHGIEETLGGKSKGQGTGSIWYWSTEVWVSDSLKFSFSSDRVSLRGTNQIPQRRGKTTSKK
ncbi:hypothetical protein POM88_049739 [Heracleum sosnowskyi]|uniref:Uncharacterized protein n=1 Tax=Heracleum sosnowskyi TaxID=360622 RepID=A0AAD8GXK0_9APIA|nr:hypothetical protein POM88_049739 [Heracleum sosnowskyi]